MGTPRWWEILLPASSRSAEYARLDPGRVRRSICRALVTVCRLQPSRPGPSMSSLGPGQGLGQAARRASTSSRTPSITEVGGVCSNPSGRAKTTTCCGLGASEPLDLVLGTASWATPRPKLPGTNRLQHASTLPHPERQIKAYCVP